MKSISAEYARFLVSGAVRTAVIYGLYLALLIVLDYQVAYGIAYLAGIVLAYALDTRFVFRSEWSWRGFLQFPLVYVAQYLVGVALLWFLVERLGIDPAVAPILVLVVLVPLTFLMSRSVLRSPLSR